MSWHILGAGSLGGLWATRLARAGIPVRLILRSAERLERYQQTPGLTLIENGVAQPLAIPAELPSTPGPIDHLLLACKAYDALPAITQIAPRLSHNSCIFLLQNGLGSQDQVRQAVPQARCIAVSSTEGAYRPQDNHVVFAGAGDNWLGDSLPAPEVLADLNRAGIPYQWCTDIEDRLWRKFAMNCAINPLTVLYDCRNGELRQHSARLQRLCAELSQLLQASQHAPAAIDLYPQVLKVIEGTAANLSSMLQDVRAQRRTEISYLLAYAHQHSLQLSLALPELATLYQQLCQHLRQCGLPDH